MRLWRTSVFVDDQAKAHAFYTDVLGFETKQDVPLGEDRWLTVVAKDDPQGTQLLLEPSGHRAVGPFKQALVHDGIPAASFQVEDLDAEVTRLKGRGVTFTQDPMDAGALKMAILDDTCGNLIQLVEIKAA